MCECGCHDTQAACSPCCLDIIKEKNKHMSYLHPTDALFKRVDKLESMYQFDFEKTKEVIDVLEKQTQAILELEEWKEVAIEKNIQDIEKIRSLEQKWHNSIDGYAILIQRIEKIENHICFNRDNRADLNAALSDIQNDYKDKIENYRIALNSLVELNVKNLHDRIDGLEKQIKNWEEEFYFLKDKSRTTDKKPHKCPVCDGRGKIQLILPAGGFWEQNCASCGMNGVVWG